MILQKFTMFTTKVEQEIFLSRKLESLTAAYLNHAVQ